MRHIARDVHLHGAAVPGVDGRSARPGAAPADRAVAAGRSRRRLDGVGLTFAVAFFCLSVTPSLLPRTWLVQGLVSGIVTATGYLAGGRGGPRCMSCPIERDPA
jgi:hypothetical protein